MEYGTWKFDDASKKIILNHNDGNKDEYKIAKLATDELVVVNTGIESITQLKYVSEGKTYSNPLNDPFHINEPLHTGSDCQGRLQCSVAGKEIE